MKVGIDMDHSQTMVNGSQYVSSMMFTGPVYNGDIWRKIDLMKYLETAISLKAQIDAHMQIRSKLLAKESFLNQQMTRKQLTYPVVTKPTGLAALSIKKQREYAQWLAEEDHREKARRSFEAEENKRITKLNQEKNAVQLIAKEEYRISLQIVEQYNAHMLQHVIPPDYRDDSILRILFKYLIDNRAHTLTDAINLYHQEKHWKTMEDIAEQQRRDIQTAQRQQHNLLREQIMLQQEQMQMQAEYLQSIENSVNSARRTMESAELWLMLDYLKD